MDFGAVALEYHSFFMIVPLLLTLAFYGFIVYVLVSLLRFMKQKTESDRERNAKLGELISLLRETNVGRLKNEQVDENR
ncbi:MULTISPECIES: hypothetical protein [Bacillales]|jgi:hypothetical protein|uniref:DUF4083 domain-containing protein n=2 Tax=Brevibacillus TaxID=55080 RepID=A0AA48M5J2_9BACL|nr:MULTISPECIES: hypothetical protein [Bacillales]CAJ1001657.1 DUF4083 domain-containing protein [Brevibacillus aydinogluensis]